MSKPVKEAPAQDAETIDPVRTGWVICADPKGELGWYLREVELPESVVEKHTVREWPSEIMSIALSNVEQRIGRKLVERLP